MLSVQALLEEVSVKKIIEARTFKLSEDIVQGNGTTIQGLEDNLASSESLNKEFESRVLALEATSKSMGMQLGSMRDGGGTVFFPCPIVGSLTSPLFTTHDLNACSICSLWFRTFDYEPISYGHVYHPFCLWEHSRMSSQCTICGEFFGLHNIAAIGVRPDLLVVSIVDVKKAMLSMKEVVLYTNPKASDSIPDTLTVEGDETTNIPDCVPGFILKW